jgi:hypothetical protein
VSLLVRVWCALFVCVVGVLCCGGVAVAASAEAGRVRYVKEADTSFESYVRAPSAEQAQWMREHYFRQKTYAPYFDSRTSWYPNAWSYRDAYAIYGESDPAQQWVLRDPQGRRLYIPWGCQGGSCPQFAADIGSPAFRRWWIDNAIRTLRNGYRGLFVDDVNLLFKVSDGNGTEVAPLDPRTGRAMTESDWRRYMAEFVEQISSEVKAALPGIEIAHNPIWFAGHTDPYTQRALLAADYIDLERGVSDNFSGGGGTYGLETFLAHVDWLHQHGKAVVYDSYTNTQDGAEYNLAAYFLTAEDRDGFRTSYRQTPDNWWAAYNVQLGAPTGPRYSWNGLLRRDFQNGYALLNQPGATTKTLTLPPDALAPDNTPRTTTTLPPASGRIILTGGGAITLRGGGRGKTRKARARARATLVLRAVANPRGTRKARRVRARSARRSSTALVRGRVRHATGGRVRLVLRRKIGRRWHVVRRSSTPLRHGKRFRRVFRGLRRGSYRVQARYLTRAGHVTARRSRHMQIRR